MLLKRLILLLLAGVFVVNHALTREVTADGAIDFNRDIRPILSDKCLQCHGPDETTRKARLRFDTQEGAMAKPGVIVPGDAAASRLIKRVISTDPDLVMPPPSTGHQLTAKEVAQLKQWIDEGAKWAQHWAYITPVRPALPALKSRGSSWVRNPIDAFVLARLEREGLQPSAEADRLTLLRRVTFDLTGLPPTLAEAEAFLADKSPEAYEKLVDRLLASPHYGERWARPWLDLARYADSHGYERDRPRVMWKYRDWVIDALNADKPFDQFTIEQLAGDLLPGATNEQLIATGFHRNTMLNQEGGVDDEEARWETLVDRTNTTATVWLGSTFTCAQCHNHKYDPFSQKEYYQLLAFYDAHEYKMLVMPGSEGWVIEPELELPTPEQAARRSAFQAEIKAVESRLKAETPELTAAQRRWESEIEQAPQTWQTLTPVGMVSTGGTQLSQLPDQSILAAPPASGAVVASDAYEITLALPALNGAVTGLRLEVLPDPSLPKGGPGRDIYGNYVMSEFEAQLVPAKGAPRPLKFARALVDDGVGRTTLYAPYRWTIDATRDEQRQPRQAVFLLDQPQVISGGTKLRVRLDQASRVVNQGLGRVRFTVTTAESPLRIVEVPLRLRRNLAIAPSARTAPQQESLTTQFRQVTPLLQKERERLEELNKAIDELGIIKAPIIRERQSAERPSTELRVRGSYTNRGERVEAATPAALNPWPADAPLNRLGLARWLVSADNPLTSRVMVNRFWEQLFGRGLVETSEDFGRQGSMPTHPELLDWLAVEFRTGKWSVKHLLRLMVTSATYRQSSNFDRRVDDPDNRLLARGPRFRLDAETIRDAALLASGLLDAKVGGPSVFPVQPEGIWANPYDGSTIKWTTSVGSDIYRRSLYTFLRRTAPYPMMTTFDAPSREFCTVRRVRTNTPLQALNLLNDEALFDLARALAGRMRDDVRGGVAERLGYGFRRCLTRSPAPTELARLERLYQEQLEIYRRDPAAAKQVAKGMTGDAAEAAALTMVANVLLNLDEMLTKE